MSGFASTLIAWQRRRGRQGLPWQESRDPYRVWLSEVMLQQTQVASVIPYYERFLRAYPTVEALARADEEDVLRLWSGLGYYARARNLHAAAREVARHGFPETAQKLARLPGVGRSTAAAIAAFAYGERAAILDGNVKRVLARCFGVEGEAAQWALAERLLPRRDIGAYTQGLMDLGATVCTRRNPGCGGCPMRKRCVALRENRVAELPSPRRSRRVPTRRATWLVLLHAGQVLLERRAPSGLWGGLWAFPEGSADDVAGLGSVRRLDRVLHPFTHFRLCATPLLCVLERSAPQLQSPGRLWLPLGEAAAAAVPAPVRRLIGSLAAQRLGEPRDARARVGLEQLLLERKRKRQQLRKP